jgi:hypothetical protein
MFRSYLAATHQRKWVILMPVPGSKAVRKALCSRHQGTQNGSGPGTSPQ